MKASTAAAAPDDTEEAGSSASAHFAHGTEWVRADFHLHTKVDKEFAYKGDENDFAAQYIDKLKAAGIRVGLITNHNKFNLSEFKSLRKRARKEGICLLPGVELSVNDGANGVHTLIAFSDDWIDSGDHINQFLTNTFSGRLPAQYENENGRSNDGIVETLRKLETYHRDFFVVFAHVEAASGLWNEIDGGRLRELGANPLVQRYCLGFQKVRTHDKGDKCRIKVQDWWKDNYPAELEGSDPKSLEEIGRGKTAFVKIGDPCFDAVKFALTDFKHRVAAEAPAIGHSFVTGIRFEGGLLNGQKASFSPHLNCVIGIRGSGKSAIVECLRYALGIDLTPKAEDKDYKSALVPHVLKSGGKVIVSAVDRHGARYEVHRLTGHNSSDVYVEGELNPGISVRDTIIQKPMYFGQKDLSAAGKGFGSDLVEKLVGDDLKTIRAEIVNDTAVLKTAVATYTSAQAQLDELEEVESELKNVIYRLEQFDKHGIKEKLEKQVAFDEDLEYCGEVDELGEEWRGSIADAVELAEEQIGAIEAYESKYNTAFFTDYEKKLTSLKATLNQGKTFHGQVDKAVKDLAAMRANLEKTKDGLKEEFAQIERDLVKSLKDQGITSIQPDDYKQFTQRKSKLESRIAELRKSTSKQKGKEEAVYKALTVLNESWRSEYMTVSAALDEINSAQTALQVNPTFKGDKEAFKAKLEEKFKGQSIRKEALAAIAEKYADFGEVFKDLDEAAKLAKSKADTFKQIFQDKLGDHLCTPIPNSYEVTYHGKALKSHSLGQRASAMMLFILSQKDKDLLIIDQPEDDLDSQTVYEEVVKLLRAIKSRQQFIFATHNANFPVLGDAETITSCVATGDAIAVQTGSIDAHACQENIVRIMEGGPEAFERRKTIYQIWSAGAAART